MCSEARWCCALAAGALRSVSSRGRRPAGRAEAAAPFDEPRHPNINVLPAYSGRRLCGRENALWRGHLSRQTGRHAMATAAAHPPPPKSARSARPRPRCRTSDPHHSGVTSLRFSHDEKTQPRQPVRCGPGLRRCCDGETHRAASVLATLTVRSYTLRPSTSHTQPPPHLEAPSAQPHADTVFVPRLCRLHSSRAQSGQRRRPPPT